MRNLHLTHSRPQSPSFIGHVVLKRGALEAAVTGCLKTLEIRSRMCVDVTNITAHAHNGFCPHRSTGQKMLLPELSREWLLWAVLKIQTSLN